MGERWQAQRRSERIPLEHPVYVSTLTGNEECRGFKLVDLGLLGCQVEGGIFFGVGRVVTIDMKIPDCNMNMRSVARVRHEYRDNDGRVRLGLEFMYLDDKYRDCIGSILENRSAVDQDKIGYQIA